MSSHAEIYAVIRRIPSGRVATYGQIADLVGLAGHARQVGYALSALEDESVPWHRVVNAQGRISARTDVGEGGDTLQRTRLESEGVRFDDTDRISLDRYRWQRSS